jgi:RNA polymerase sigma-70 factor (ECF subfamily)
MTTTRKQVDDTVVCDEALAEDARGGSGAAFAGLVRRHSHAVYAIARNLCTTSRDAEEVLQQTFLAAWRDVHCLPDGARITTWLYGIAVKTALAHRQRNRRKRSCSLESFLPAFDPAGRLVPGKGIWPESDGSSLRRVEMTGLLRDALECVDDHTRAVFVLRDLLELPVDETAAIMEVSPQAVQRDAHRMRLMLRGFLDQLGYAAAS